MTTAEKAWAGTAGGPVQIGVIVCVAVDLLAVGGDDVQADDALARRAVDAAVPAVPALQQITAETDALAVAAGEEQALRLQVGHEQTAALARTDDGRFPLGIDRCVIEPADVEQHRAVAEMVGRETVSTRNDADLVSVGLGIPDPHVDVVGINGLDDHLGVALWHSLMPHGATAGRLVAVFAAEKVPSGR